MRGSIIAGRFEIEGVAGKGGMGTVFRARERETTSTVALKIVDERHANDRFLQEAELLARLSDERIVRYVSHGALDDGRMYLAMEWLEGTPLDVMIDEARLPVSDAIQVASRLARALAAAHQLGVVHRDVKPSNVILRGGSPADAVLVDFGIARATKASYVMTATGVVIGTPAYMAPEQARGERADARADIFSLGCVLFECLCGRPAFMGEHAIAVLAKILLEPAPSVRALRDDVPESLNRLVAAMLEKDRALRPASADAVAEELDAIASGRVVLGRSRAVPEAPSIGARERRLVTVVLARPRVETDCDAFASMDEPLAGLTREAAVSERAALHGVTLAVLPGGTLLGAVVAENAGADAAERAVRCALALTAGADAATVALASGRAIVDGVQPMGEAIDRAAALFAEHPGAGVWIDEATASIVEARFELDRSPRGILAVAERAPVDRIRTVMGRVVPFVGRDREIALLEGTFAECVDEPVARAVLVIAEPGVGKSRLQRELTARVAPAHPTARLWQGLADPMMMSAPFALAGDVLRAALGIRVAESLDARRERLLERVRGVVGGDAADDVARFLGEIVETPFDDAAAPALRAARADSLLMGARLKESFLAFALAELAKGPVLFILEDVHWADPGSLRLFSALLASAKDLPLLVLALARPAVDTAHPKLWEEAMCQRILLGPLLRKAATTMARAVLGDHPEIEAIVQRAAGNALFVEELTRACGLQGCAPRSCACSSDVVDDLPPTIAAATEARLGSLEPEARKLLRAAAVFGERFWEGGVGSLVGDEAAGQLGVQLTRLESMEILSPAATSRFADAREWVFRHALVRDAAYAMLTADDRRLGHALAAGWLEKRTDDAALLAHHFERGDRRDEAAREYVRATEDAVAASDGALLSSHAAKARESGASGALLGRVRLCEAEMSFYYGKNAEAGTEARDAMRLLERGDERWFRATGIGAAAVGKCMDAITLGELVAELESVPARDPTAGRARAIARARASMQLLYAGRPDRAAALLEGCEDELGAAGDPSVLAWLADAAFERAFSSGSPMRPDLSQRARHLHTTIGDRRAATMAAGTHIMNLILVGAFEAARSEAEAFGKRADAGATPLLAYLESLTVLLPIAFSGKPEAFAAAVDGMMTKATMASPRAALANQIWLTLVLVEVGHIDDASRRIAVLVERELPPVFDSAAFAVASLAAWARGDAAAAKAFAERARTAAAGGIASWARTALDVAWVRALALSGDARGARSALDEGLAALRGRAAELGDYGPLYLRAWHAPALLALEGTLAAKPD